MTQGKSIWRVLAGVARFVPEANNERRSLKWGKDTMITMIDTSGPPPTGPQRGPAFRLSPELPRLLPKPRK